MIHFNAKLWNNHQLCVLQILNLKETNSARKTEKLAKEEMLRHNFRMLRHNLKVTSRAMLQQAMLCSNKDKVELKLKVKIVATFQNFVAT